MRFLTSLSAALFLPLAALAQEEPAPEPPAIPYVKIVPVESSGTAFNRQFYGRVAARQTVDIAFQVGGQLVELPAVEGQPIEEGALIARLDVEPYQIAYDQAVVQKQQADRNLARLSKLSGSTVSKVSVDDARTAVDLAEIAIRNAKRSLDNATLTAPFDALVAARNVSNFTTIAAGTPIVRLHDMSELHIEIEVPEVLFQQPNDGGDFTIEAQFVSSPKRFPLSIREFNAEASQVGQTFRMTFGMSPPEGLNILPGNSVTVYASGNSGDEILTVPVSAVKLANDKSAEVFVYAPSADDPNLGSVARKKVTIAPTEAGRMQITSGLAQGDEIVATGTSRLTDGQEVRRFTGFPN